MKQYAELFSKNGYVVIPKVINPLICSKTVDAIENLKKQSGFLSFQNGRSEDRKHTESGFYSRNNKVSYFFQNTYSNDPQLRIDSMIKVGHCLHHLPIFKQITQSKEVLALQQEIGLIAPLMVQSMSLQKLPVKGGKVAMHQDSTYLRTEPDTITGFWLPLQDVTTQNGCMWVLPGSHKSKIYYKYKYFDGEHQYVLDGPIDYKEEDCIPLPMEKGSLLILSGRLLHKSNDNLSKRPRNVYTWHVMSRDSTWQENNWLSKKQIDTHQYLQ